MAQKHFKVGDRVYFPQDTCIYSKMYKAGEEFTIDRVDDNGVGRVYYKGRLNDGRLVVAVADEIALVNAEKPLTREDVQQMIDAALANKPAEPKPVAKTEFKPGDYVRVKTNTLDDWNGVGTVVKVAGVRVHVKMSTGGRKGEELPTMRYMLAPINVSEYLTEYTKEKKAKEAAKPKPKHSVGSLIRVESKEQPTLNGVGKVTQVFESAAYSERRGHVYRVQLVTGLYKSRAFSIYEDALKPASFMDIFDMHKEENKPKSGAVKAKPAQPETKTYAYGNVPFTKLQVGDTVHISRTANDQWTGNGVVDKLSMEMEIVSVKMTSGTMKGFLGGFTPKQVELVEKNPRKIVNGDMVYVTYPYWKGQGIVTRIPKEDGTDCYKETHLVKMIDGDYAGKEGGFEPRDIALTRPKAYVQPHHAKAAEPNRAAWDNSTGALDYEEIKISDVKVGDKIRFIPDGTTRTVRIMEFADYGVSVMIDIKFDKNSHVLAKPDDKVYLVSRSL